MPYFVRNRKPLSNWLVRPIHPYRRGVMGGLQNSSHIERRVANDVHPHLYRHSLNRHWRTAHLQAAQDVVRRVVGFVPVLKLMADREPQRTLINQHRSKVGRNRREVNGKRAAQRGDSSIRTP